MKRQTGILAVVGFCVALYWQFWFKGLVPAPFDTLVGAYYPWLDYKWGQVVGVPVKNALLSDAYGTFFIWKYLAADQFKQGIIPLWNPYVFSGTPLLATFHSAVLFPGNILLWLPKYSGWGVYIFASTLSSGLLMYALLKRLVKNNYAAVTGAVIYASAGPMTTWAEFGTAVWAMASLPLLLLLPLRKFNSINILSVSAVTLFMVLAGHVQILTYTAGLFLLWLGFLVVNRKISRVGFIKFILAFAAGVCLAGIQLIPTAELYKNSIRGAESYAAQFNYGLSPPENVVRFWAADFWGNPTTYNHFGSVVYHEYSGFLGTITVILILSFIIRGKKNNIDKFWVFILGGTLILLIDNPLSRIVFSLPFPLLTYSSASRLLFVVTLAAAILAGRSIDKMTKGTSTTVTIIALITVGVFMTIPADDRIITGRNLVIPGIMAVSGIIFIKLKKPWLLVLLIALDLFRYFTKYNPFVPEAYIFPRTPVIEYLQKHAEGYQFVRQKTNLIPLNTWTPYGLVSPEGYDPLHYSEYHRLFNQLNNKPADDKVSRYADLDDININKAIEMGVKYYVGVDKTRDPILEKLTVAGWKKVFTDKSVSVWKNDAEVKKIQPVRYFPKSILWGSGISLISLGLLVIYRLKANDRRYIR